MNAEQDPQQRDKNSHAARGVLKGDHNKVKMAITDTLMRRFILRRKKIPSDPDATTNDTPASPLRTALRHSVSTSHLETGARQSSFRRTTPGTERPPKKQLSFREPERKPRKTTPSARCNCRDKKSKFISGSESDSESSASSADLSFDVGKINAVKETAIESWSSEEDIKSQLRKSASSEVLFLPSKKPQSQAAEIVRTIGQAFEVCHKLNQQRGLSQEHEGSNKLEKEIEDEKKVSTQDSGQTIISTPSKQPQTPSVSSVSEAPPPFGAPEIEPSASLSYIHQLQLLRAQMEYQAQTAQQAMSQVKLLREQLSAENAARIDAMSQNQLLTQQNRELIQHIQILVKQIQELEISRQTSALQEVSLSPIRGGNAPSVFDFPSNQTPQHGQSGHMWLNVGPPSGGSSPRPPASPNVPSSLFADMNKFRLEERLNSSVAGTLPPMGSWSAGASPLSSLPPIINGYGTLPALSSATPSPFMRQYSLPVPGSKSSYPGHPSKPDMSRLTISESVVADANGVPPSQQNGRNRSPTVAPEAAYGGSVFLS